MLPCKEILHITIRKKYILDEVFLTGTHIKQVCVWLVDENTVIKSSQELKPIFPLGTMALHSVFSIHSNCI